MIKANFKDAKTKVDVAALHEIALGVFVDPSMVITVRTLITGGTSLQDRETLHSNSTMQIILEDCEISLTISNAGTTQYDLIEAVEESKQ